MGKLINMNIFQIKKCYPKFTYFPLAKVLEKQRKTIENQEEKQIKALEKHWKQPIMYNFYTAN